tara:strand:+ start:678 stop:1400 length:723 start_codon:yes stop_codon:yes gene_type:complete
MVNENNNEILNENLKRIGTEISNLKRLLDSENLKLLNLRTAMQNLLNLNSKDTYSNEFGRYSIAKRKQKFRRNLRSEIENADKSFIKELLDDGIIEIEQKYVLNFESDLLNNEEVLKKLDKYLNMYEFENYLTYNINKAERLKKVNLENTVKVCKTSKLLEDSCTQVCCTIDDDNVCHYCGEIDDGTLNPGCCDEAFEDLREERELEEEHQREQLRELYETGLEYLNIEEMEISDYEKGY